MIKYVILLGIAVTAAGSQYLLKVGLDTQQVPTLSPLRFLQHLAGLLTNPALLFAGVLYVLSLVLYMFLLTNLEVSRLYPMSLGLNFIMVIAVAWLLLREPMNLSRMLGMGIIILGIYLVERS